MRQNTVLDGKSLITPQAISAHFLASDSPTKSQNGEQARAELALVLQIALQQFESEVDPAKIIHRAAGALHGIRKLYAAEIWQQLIPIAQQHPVAQYFLQDPFTRWSFDKPRGYSGDAQLLDFIYGHPSVSAHVEGATALGKALYAYTREASSSVAVRERRDILADFVDECANRCEGSAEVLTIAAGHLREARLSKAFELGKVKRWLALDQDPISIGSIHQEYAGTVVDPVDGSVLSLLKNEHALGKFDCVYAAGLYDYLNDKVSIKLTQKCLDMLKPGGSFLFANFATEIQVDGYMETFMNWALLLRSEEDMWRIVRGATVGMNVDCSLRYGENRNIVYAVIRKLD